MKINRRELVLGTAALAGSACTSMPPSGKPKRGLGALAAEKGVVFGSAINTRQVSDPAYVRLVREECAAVVAENAQKMYTIKADADEWNFAPPDTIAQFAEREGVGLRGHALLWNHPNYLPDWMKTYRFASASEAETFLRTYIDRVAGRYSPQIFAWDVVNETIDPKTGALRDTPFTQALGAETIPIAFDAARSAAPGATLAYNDYMTWEEGNETHRTAVLRFLETLLKADVPIDGLGVQAHAKWTDREGEFSAQRQRDWRAFLDEVSGMGLELYFTELDVNDSDATGPDDVRDQEIAAYTKDYLDLVLSYPQTKEILTWGLVDHDSWIQAFVDGDELVRRPLPFDDEYRPKPMYDAMAAAFRAAPVRSGHTSVLARYA